MEIQLPRQLLGPPAGPRSYCFGGCELRRAKPDPKQGQAEESPSGSPDYPTTGENGGLQVCRAGGQCPG